MSTLTRQAFLAEMSDQTISLAVANNDVRLHRLNLNQVDYNNDGLINTTQEMKALFRAVDYFDNNGVYRSVYMGTSEQPTVAGKLIQALRDIAEPAHIEQTITLTLSDFLAEMQNKHIVIIDAHHETRLQDFDLYQADLNQTGTIAEEAEFTQLFRAIDHYDRNGDARSLNLGNAQHPTTAGIIVTALRELAQNKDVVDVHVNGNGNSKPATTFKDAAIRNAFPRHITATLKHGDKGDKVVAIQYALGRLGHLEAICDGDFGNKTLAAVQSFQSATPPLLVTGRVDSQTLTALDNAVVQVDLRPPVIRSKKRPMSYLSDFRTLGLPKIALTQNGKKITWDSPEIQRAYGSFVQKYWEVMKENQIEADCKALALFFMDQFRKKLKEDTGIKLSLPRSAKGSIAKRDWMIATRQRPRGLFRRVMELFFKHHIRVNRPGYQALKNIQKLDPEHAMIYGVNVKYPRTSAHQVSRAATVIAPWYQHQENYGDYTKAEIPLQKLKVGYLIFIDHTGNGSYDHTVTVVKIKKDLKRRVRQLVLAVGSYDDVRDSLASTVVNSLGILNQYAEEVVVDFDQNERITHAEVTYSSEPKYVVKPRYSHTSTLMERKQGGTLKVSRWGS